MELFVEILMRRARLEHEAPIVLGPLLVDRSSRRCSIEGQNLGLTRAEFDILQQLALNAGRLVSIAELTHLLGAIDNASSRARVRQHMYVLRRKSPVLTEIVRTVRGCGYLLQARG